MQYLVQVNMAGAAFEDATPAVEVARILRKLADGLERGGITATDPEDWCTLYDANGNRCGTAAAVESKGSDQ